MEKYQKRMRLDVCRVWCVNAVVPDDATLQKADVPVNTGEYFSGWKLT